MKVEKTKLFKKWLLTYLFLIIISLIFVYSIYKIYDKNMKEDLLKLNKTYLQQIVNLFDDQFNSIDKLVYTIGLNDRFINLINIDQELTTSDRYEIIRIVQDLDLFSRANSAIEQIDLYAKKPMFVIGRSSAHYQKYIELYTQSAFGMDATDYLVLMEQSYNREVLRLNDWFPANSSGNPLIYLQTLPIQYQDNPKGTIMVVIDEKKLEAFGKDKLLPNGILLVFNENKQLIYSNDKELYLMPLPVDVLTELDSNEITIDGADYIKDTVVTGYNDWTYVSLVPKAVYYVRINQVRIIISVMVGLFFLVNILIAYFFTNRMYMPVRRIITSFKSDQKFSSQSEYEYIESVIQKNNLDQEKMKRDLYLQRRPLKNAFFSKLLRGYIKDLKYIEEQFEIYDILISNVGFQVLLIEFSHNQDEQSKNALSQFIIQNIFEEILSNYFSCQVVELENRVAVIVSYDQESILIKELEGDIITTLDLIDRKFELNCLIGISSIHTFFGSLSNAYQECLEAISQARLLEDGNVIYFEDTQNLSTQYEYSTEHEYRLIHFVKIGDLSQTLSVIDEVINQNIQDQLLKVGYLHCMMFDLIGSIIKSINDPSFNEMLNKKDPIRRMMVASNIEEMKRIIVDVATIACKINENHFHQVKKFRVEEQINTYIEQHFSDSNLNVAKLGEVFNMTPAYLSKIYKSETGNSLLHTLNKVRIEASKKLLMETGLSINEISEKVGYVYCNAFIRFFKNHTGITPGQYKNLGK